MLIESAAGGVLICGSLGCVAAAPRRLAAVALAAALACAAASEVAGDGL